MSNVIPLDIVTYLETRAGRTGRAAFLALTRAGLCPGSAAFDGAGWRLLRARTEKLFPVPAEPVEDGSGPTRAAARTIWQGAALRTFQDMTKAAAPRRTRNVEEAHP